MDETIFDLVCEGFVAFVSLRGAVWGSEISLTRINDPAIDGVEVSVLCGLLVPPLEEVEVDVVGHWTFHPDNDSKVVTRFTI